MKSKFFYLLCGAVFSVCSLLLLGGSDERPKAEPNYQIPINHRLYTVYPENRNVLKLAQAGDHVDVVARGETPHVLVLSHKKILKKQSRSLYLLVSVQEISQLLALGSGATFHVLLKSPGDSSKIVPPKNWEIIGDK